MKRLKYYTSFILVLCMCFSLFFFHVPVFAENSTYFINNSCFEGIKTTNNNNIICFQFGGQSDIRIVCVHAGSYIGFYGVSKNGFVSGNASSNSCPSDLTSSSNQKVINGVTYYYKILSGYPYSYSECLVDTPIHNASNSSNAVDVAIEYTFGYSAIDPEPEGPDYGYVAGTQYNTRINGSRDHVGQNIDRLVWLTDVDSKGNVLPVDARIQIRAIPGMYTGNSKQDVLTKTYTDFIIDNTNAVQLVDLVLDVGKYEIMWEEVANKLSIPFSSVQSIIQGSDYFYKMGWIYQIRLQVDNYFSDWQTVNTATSSGASESQTIVDSEAMTQNLIDVILTINTLNESVNTNWTINNYTISMDTYNEPSSGDKPWWAYLLEAILSVFDVDGDSQQVINNTNTLNVDFNDKLNEYNQIEDQQIQNLDDSLDQINTESDLINNNKFINSANWVTQQYNRITNNNPVGSLIGFSLLFGLALIFIGKIG